MLHTCFQILHTLVHFVALFFQNVANLFARFCNIFLKNIVALPVQIAAKLFCTALSCNIFLKNITRNYCITINLLHYYFEMF
jgi:hypothetical protein